MHLKWQAIGYLIWLVLTLVMTIFFKDRQDEPATKGMLPWIKAIFLIVMFIFWSVIVLVAWLVKGA